MNFFGFGGDQRVFSEQFELTSWDFHGSVNNNVDDIFIARRGGRGPIVHKEVGVKFHEFVGELFEGETQ